MLAVTEGVREYVEAKSPRRWVVLMLHSSLSVEEQDKVWDEAHNIAPLVAGGGQGIERSSRPFYLSCGANLFFNMRQRFLPHVTGLRLQIILDVPGATYTADP